MNMTVAVQTLFILPFLSEHTSICQKCRNLMAKSRTSSRVANYLQPMMALDGQLGGVLQ